MFTKSKLIVKRGLVINFLTIRFTLQGYFSGLNFISSSGDSLMIENTHLTPLLIIFRRHITVTAFLCKKTMNFFFDGILFRLYAIKIKREENNTFYGFLEWKLKRKIFYILWYFSKKLRVIFSICKVKPFHFFQYISYQTDRFSRKEFARRLSNSFLRIHILRI